MAAAKRKVQELSAWADKSERDAANKLYKKTAFETKRKFHRDLGSKAVPELVLRKKLDRPAWETWIRLTRIRSPDGIVTITDKGIAKARNGEPALTLTTIKKGLVRLRAAGLIRTIQAEALRWLPCGEMDDRARFEMGERVMRYAHEHGLKLVPASDDPDYGWTLVCVREVSGVPYAQLVKRPQSGPHALVPPHTVSWLLRAFCWGGRRKGAGAKKNAKAPRTGEAAKRRAADKFAAAIIMGKVVTREAIMKAGLSDRKVATACRRIQRNRELMPYYGVAPKAPESEALPTNQEVQKKFKMDPRASLSEKQINFSSLSLRERKEKEVQPAARAGGATTAELNLELCEAPPPAAESRTGPRAVEPASSKPRRVVRKEPCAAKPAEGPVQAPTFAVSEPEAPQGSVTPPDVSEAARALLARGRATEIERIRSYAVDRADNAFCVTPRCLEGKRLDNFIIGARRLETFGLDAVKIPAPAVLERTAPLKRRVEIVVRALRTLIAYKYNTARYRFAFGRGDLQRSKWWPALSAITEALTEEGVAPMAWFDWSIGAWAKMRERSEKENSIPPFGFLFSVERLGKHLSWHRSEYSPHDGGVIMAPYARSICTRRELALQILAVGVPITEVEAALYPEGGIEEAKRIANRETERAQRDLRARRDRGEYLWGGELRLRLRGA